MIMHDRKLESIADETGIGHVSSNCAPHIYAKNAIASVCIECGDSQPGWLVRRVQALEDQVAKLREFTQPENR